MKVLVTTFPFSENDPRPAQILAQSGAQVLVNPYGRKMTTEEVRQLARDVDVIVAGTERLDQTVFDACPRVKLVARVGIGLDGLQLEDLQNRGIKVTYTPDAPAPAVSELTIGLMLSALRFICPADQLMHAGGWKRFFGKRIGESVIGVVGAGRIGSRVIEHLRGFYPKKILVVEKNPERVQELPAEVEACSFARLEEEADVITFHIPLNHETRNFVTMTELKRMVRRPLLINTSRGGIINEADLFHALKQGLLFGAAIDVFEQEPYNGPLKELTSCVLTSHMGSMSEDCRLQMEIEACTEVKRFLAGESLLREVPEAEYIAQKVVKHD